MAGLRAENRSLSMWLRHRWLGKIRSWGLIHAGLTVFAHVTSLIGNGAELVVSGRFRWMAPLFSANNSSRCCLAGRLA